MKRKKGLDFYADDWTLADYYLANLRGKEGKREISTEELAKAFESAYRCIYFKEAGRKLEKSNMALFLQQFLLCLEIEMFNHINNYLFK